MFSLSDPVVNELLIMNNADESTLRKLYADLRLVAEVTYNNGFFVPASSIIDTFSLCYLLQHFDGDRYFVDSLDGYNSLLLIANKLVMYFTTNDTRHLWIQPTT